MAATARVIWLCACVRYWPDRGLVLSVSLAFIVVIFSEPPFGCLKIFGVLDEKLTFETHIEYISKKACTGIGALRRIKPFVPLCALVTYTDHSLNLILITARPCGIRVVSN